MKNRLLERKYYEYDNAFYFNKINISCWEQMQYQSIRDYNIDYFLIFCNDINVMLSEKNMKWYVYPNDLGYNRNVFKYINRTTIPSKAEKEIKSIINHGKIVIFQTAWDYLQTCVWYHDKAPYTCTTHNSILVGYNKDYFFYTDSPAMRNSQYFISLRENPAIGCINCSELLDSFHIHCKIGFINVNENELCMIADIRKILLGIKENYNSTFHHYLLGKMALVKLSNLLINNEEIHGIFEDSYPYELIVSRHKRLLMNLIKYKNTLKGLKGEEMINLVKTLVDRWQIVKYLVIKYNIKQDFHIKYRMSEILQVDIIPITNRLIETIEKL